MSLISVKNVNFSYDKHQNVLKDLSLSIERGEYVAIVGKNGSGKSTLAKVFNGLVIPLSGEVIVDGDDVIEAHRKEDKKTLYAIRGKVGMVFQNPDNQTVASIVEDDIAFGPENLGVKREEIKERIDFALKAVGMEEFKRFSPTRLSGGQKQRIAIAGVLALLPQVLVLDEATAMLDPVGRKEVLSVIDELNKNGTTIVTITHYMEEVLRADKVFVMNDGDIVLSGTPKEIFAPGKELCNYGLELPVPKVIADELKEKGLPLPDDIFTEEELAEALCRL